AHGITAVRDAGSDPDSIYTLRSQFDREQAVGPRLYVTGAAIDVAPGRGTNVGVMSTSEIRRQIGLRALDADYAFLSSQIDDTLFGAALDEAEGLNVTVAAHLGRINAVTAADMGLKVIDHLSGIVETIAPRPDWFREGHRDVFVGFNRSFAGWTRVDSAGIDSVARVLVDAGVTIIPTLFFFEAYSNLQNPSFIAGIDQSAIPQDRRWDIGAFMRQAGLTAGEFPLFRHGRRLQNLFIRRFKALGGSLVAGSNTPWPLMAPGSSLHRELQQLVQAGISEKDALLAATRDAAEVLDADSLGTIQRGKSADFVILSADPLEDIANLSSVEMVVVRGRIFAAADLLPR
ncbi:MAG: amidohydrolase family protein, partial [Gemmatimonadota bacterium]|nr:amidohydrolase family protein [Gemmatimonadota bacterium]